MDIATVVRRNVREAERQAKEILADPRTAVLDTETTGLNGAFIVDIAIIARGKTLINTLVNPQVSIPADASAIHGIRDIDVVGAPTFDQLWPAVRKILRTKRLVIYNAPYDLRILQNEMKRLGVSSPGSVEVDCAMKLYQQWYLGGIGQPTKHTTRLVDPHCSAEACQALAKEHAQAAHRARADCLATVKRLQLVANTCWLHGHVALFVRDNTEKRP